MAAHDLPPVVCDTGTGVIKAGFAGFTEPHLAFPTLLGRPMLRYDQGLGGATLADVMVGEAANTHRSLLQLTRPIADGKVQNWDDMELIWDHAFEQLGVLEDARARHVVQTEAALNPPGNRERIVETMFEKYGFAGVNVSVQAISALHSRGLSTGFVVDAGDGVTHLCPVHQGYLEPNLVFRMNLAGRHVTEHMMKLLVGNGHPLNSTADLETVRELKQSLCYVAHDLAKERKLASETTVVDRQYTLPDSRVIRVGAERFMAPEILFTPNAAGVGSESAAFEGEGLSHAVYQTIRKSSMDTQKGYFKNIVLSGGTTMFPGFSSRLERDLRLLYTADVCKGDAERAKLFRVKVEDHPKRQHMVFLGAAIMAAANSPSSSWWISREEYEEVGSSAVHRLIPTKLS